MEQYPLDMPIAWLMIERMDIAGSIGRRAGLSRQGGTWRH